jgi:hypothetical protein
MLPSLRPVKISIRRYIKPSKPTQIERRLQETKSQLEKLSKKVSNLSNRTPRIENG